MSTETLTWLNQNVLVGFTEKRGNAWHWKASEQGDEPNHYTGAIPVADVLRRLFSFQAVERPIYVAGASGDPTGAAFRKIEDRKAIVASDNGDVLGVFKEGYVPHQYDAWLLDNVANLFDTSSTDLGIASAGLLKNRAVAWVQIETPDTISTPEGVDFRPFFTAATSLNGDLASTYQPGVQAVVCDNTLSAALGEKVQRLKVRHSSKSLGRISDAREALGIIFQVADTFSEQLANLCRWEVTSSDWDSLLDLSIPRPDQAGRGQTLADTKRSALSDLYNHDARVTPWKGTAFGALQAFNTYEIHVRPVRGSQRAERVQYAALTGQIDKADQQVILDLSRVTQRTLVSA